MFAGFLSKIRNVCISKNLQDKLTMKELNKKYLANFSFRKLIKKKERQEERKKEERTEGRKDFQFLGGLSSGANAQN